MPRSNVALAASTSKRFGSRYAVLAYNSVSAQFNFQDIRRICYMEKAAATIVEISTSSHGSKTYLAFVDFCGKRFQTRNVTMFDVQNVHPKWWLIRGNAREIYDDLTSKGRIVCAEASPPPRKVSGKTLGSMYKPDEWRTVEAPTRQDNFLVTCDDLPKPKIMTGVS